MDNQWHTLTVKTEGSGWFASTLKDAEATGLKVQYIPGAIKEEIEISNDTEILVIDDLDRMSPLAIAQVKSLLKRAHAKHEQPKLQAIWASCTQNHDDYEISALDPALLDSFEMIKTMPAPEQTLDSPDENLGRER